MSKPEKSKRKFSKENENLKNEKIINNAKFIDEVLKSSSQILHGQDNNFKKIQALMQKQIDIYDDLEKEKEDFKETFLGLIKKFNFYYVEAPNAIEELGKIKKFLDSAIGEVTRKRDSSKEALEEAELDQLREKLQQSVTIINDFITSFDTSEWVEYINWCRGEFSSDAEEFQCFGREIEKKLLKCVQETEKCLLSSAGNVDQAKTLANKYKLEIAEDEDWIKKNLEGVSNILVKSGDSKFNSQVLVSQGWAYFIQESIKIKKIMYGMLKEQDTPGALKKVFGDLEGQLPLFSGVFDLYKNRESILQPMQLEMQKLENEFSENNQNKKLLEEEVIKLNNDRLTKKRDSKQEKNSLVQQASELKERWKTLCDLEREIKKTEKRNFIGQMWLRLKYFIYLKILPNSHKYIADMKILEGLEKEINKPFCAPEDIASFTANWNDIRKKEEEINQYIEKNKKISEEKYHIFQIISEVNHFPIGIASIGKYVGSLYKMWGEQNKIQKGPKTPEESWPACISLGVLFLADLPTKEGIAQYLGAVVSWLSLAQERHEQLPLPQAILLSILNKFSGNDNNSDEIKDCLSKIILYCFLNEQILHQQDKNLLDLWKEKFELSIEDVKTGLKNKTLENFIKESSSQAIDVAYSIQPNNSLNKLLKGIKEKIVNGVASALGPELQQKSETFLSASRETLTRRLSCSSFPVSCSTVSMFPSSGTKKFRSKEAPSQSYFSVTCGKGK